MRTNRHHNISRSRGGSSARCDISHVGIRRHDWFHKWAWNRTPCAILRLLSIHGIGYEGKTLAPNALEDLCHIMQPAQWKDLYEPEAILIGNKKMEVKQHKKAKHFAKLHILDELRDVQEAIFALDSDRNFLCNRPYDLLSDAQQFFGTCCTRRLLEGLLTEKHWREFSWVKAMRSDVRQTILNLVRSADLVPLKQKETDDTLDILRDHETRLEAVYFGDRNL